MPRRRLDPSRAGRDRRRRNLLERDSAAGEGTNFRLPHPRGRGARTLDARRPRRFQRSHTRSPVWRRLVRRQRKRDLFLEQYRPAALSAGCKPVAQPGHPNSSRRRCGRAAVCGRRRRPTPGAHGLHRSKGGDHDPCGRRPLRRDRPKGSRLGEQTSIQRHVSAPMETACPG